MRILTDSMNSLSIICIAKISLYNWLASNLATLQLDCREHFICPGRVILSTVADVHALEVEQCGRKQAAEKNACITLFSQIYVPFILVCLICFITFTAALSLAASQLIYYRNPSPPPSLSVPVETARLAFSQSPYPKKSVMMMSQCTPLIEAGVEPLFHSLDHTSTIIVGVESQWTRKVSHDPP